VSSDRMLPPRDRAAVTIGPFVDLPGVANDPMKFVDHLKSYNHNVSQEVGQTFFLITDQIKQVVFLRAYSPGATETERTETESGTGPILLNWAAPLTSERSSTGRGILISAHPSRATRGTIGRL